VGGIVEGIARGVPPGWGEPVFDRLEADLGKAMLSLPASKGFDVGSGFDSILLAGTQHNDPFRMEGNRVRTTSNRSGGIQGGISNGEDIVVRGFLKPISTLRRPLESVDFVTRETSLAAYERSDVCVLPAAGVIGEAMVALVLAQAMIEKFGGDSLAEVKRNFDAYIAQVRSF